MASLLLMSWDIHWALVTQTLFAVHLEHQMEVGAHVRQLSMVEVLI
jgi:hypothetical protein